MWHVVVGAHATRSRGSLHEEMPRPGPRPYECVRRAWHSDRHQPMRGSLIQDLFRVVNQSHSEEIRKNKEWQEKLPVVVLKAEEIMYSKANSEEEYMDISTLWERANDAIDTIMRRDEGEEGKFLQPCIEAALILGCTPRRALRSQQNNSRCYLSSSTQQEDATAPARKYPKLMSFDSAPFCIGRPGNAVTSARLVPYYLQQFTPRSIRSPFNQRCPSYIPAQNCFTSDTHPFPIEDSRGVPLVPVPEHSYPVSASFGSSARPNFNIQEINPEYSSPNRGPFHNQRIQEATCLEVPDSSNRETVSACDLSLRLAPFSEVCASSKNSFDVHVEDMGSRDTPGGRKRTEFCFSRTQINNLDNSFSSQQREFSFFPVNAAANILKSYPRR